MHTIHHFFLCISTLIQVTCTPKLHCLQPHLLQCTYCYLTLTAETPSSYSLSLCYNKHHLPNSLFTSHLLCSSSPVLHLTSSKNCPYSHSESLSWSLSSVYHLSFYNKLLILASFKLPTPLSNFQASIFHIPMIWKLTTGKSTSRNQPYRPFLEINPLNPFHYKTHNRS